MMIAVSDVSFSSSIETEDGLGVAADDVMRLRAFINQTICFN